MIWRSPQDPTNKRSIVIITGLNSSCMHGGFCILTINYTIRAQIDPVVGSRASRPNPRSPTYYILASGEATRYEMQDPVYIMRPIENCIAEL